MSISFCELGISGVAAAAAAQATLVLSASSLCGVIADAKDAVDVCCARHARHASTLAVASPDIVAVCLPATLALCSASICAPEPALPRPSTCGRADIITVV